MLPVELARNVSCMLFVITEQLGYNHPTVHFTDRVFVVSAHNHWSFFMRP